MRSCFLAVLAALAANPCLAEPLKRAAPSQHPSARQALAKAGAVPSPRLRVRVAESVKSLTVRGLDLRIRSASGVPATAPGHQSEWEVRCRDGDVILRLHADSRGGPRDVVAPPVRADQHKASPFSALLGSEAWAAEPVVVAKNPAPAGAARAPALQPSPAPRAYVRSAYRLKAPVTIVSPAGFLSLNGRPYREEFRIHALSGARCEVVNHVDVEKYLNGLVNAEFSSKWSEEAVAAQVVAARTYALHRAFEARKRPGSHFDLDSTVKDQVYDGSYREDFRASRAVLRTRGTILTTEASAAAPKPIKAYYHSTCGGKTDIPSEVWGDRHAAFRSVECPYCRSSPARLWRVRKTQRELTKAIQDGASQGAAPAGWPKDWKSRISGAKLTAVEVTSRTPSGRNKAVDLVWRLPPEPDRAPAAETYGPPAPGSAPVLSEAPKLRLPLPASQLRTWLGGTKFRSTSFTVSKRRVLGGVEEWVFSGKGNGHGVGMCQWGAKIMGDQGFKMAGILKHYYPGASLRKLW